MRDGPYKKNDFWRIPEEWFRRQPSFLSMETLRQARYSIKYQGYEIYESDLSPEEKRVLEAA
jgi:hypothetical protein